MIVSQAIVRQIVYDVTKPMPAFGRTGDVVAVAEEDEALRITVRDYIGDSVVMYVVRIAERSGGFDLRVSAAAPPGGGTAAQQRTLTDHIHKALERYYAV